MIQFLLGALLGGFIGMAATCMCVVSSDRMDADYTEVCEASDVVPIFTQTDEGYEVIGFTK